MGVLLAGPGGFIKRFLGEADAEAARVMAEMIRRTDHEGLVGWYIIDNAYGEQPVAGLVQ